MRLHSSKRLVLAALALSFGLAGCASGGGGGSARPAGASPDRIVRAELADLQQMSALQAIQRLRPQWLRTRSGDAPTLYVDGGRRGSANDLSSILTGEVEQMEYINASDATNRYGTGHTGGAILVTTRR